MKKAVAFITVCLMIASFAACGSNNETVSIDEISNITASLAESEDEISEAVQESSTDESEEEQDMGYPIWDGEIAGEIKNPAAPAVFKGAWYSKCVTSKDYWCGMEIVVTLPEYDINRYKSDYNESLDCDPNVKNLDNPSVYIGGNAGYESDVGLSLSLCLVGGGVSTGSVAFRPFWRYITSTDKDVGSYADHGGKYTVSANGNNCYANWHYSYTEYYYLPGDVLKLILTVPEEGKLQLQIKVLQASTLESSVALRNKYGWRQPADFTSPVFASPGHGTSKAEFKWVMAIDQSGNEGKQAIPTTTLVKNGTFNDAYLYRVIDGEIYRVPVTDDRFGSRNAPDDQHVTVVEGEDGSRTVTIHPGYTD